MISINHLGILLVLCAIEPLRLGRVTTMQIMMLEYYWAV